MLKGKAQRNQTVQYLALLLCIMKQQFTWRARRSKYYYSSIKMDRHVLDKMIQSLLHNDENDAHEMCQDIKNTVEEYMVLNRAQLSVSERL
eukprot:scaffold15539_cov124-Skeletonema_marinoi.AAC.1